MEKIMAGVPIPEKHFEIGERLIGYASESRNQRWVNIRKTYLDLDGDRYVGKGLMISIDDWNDFSSNFKDLSEFIDKEINA